MPGRSERAVLTSHAFPGGFVGDGLRIAERSRRRVEGQQRHAVHVAGTARFLAASVAVESGSDGPVALHRQAGGPGLGSLIGAQDAGAPRRALSRRSPTRPTETTVLTRRYTDTPSTPGSAGEQLADSPVVRLRRGR